MLLLKSKLRIEEAKNWKIQKNVFDKELRNPKKITKPVFEKALGNGAYASVSLYQDESSGIRYAVKKINKNNSSKDIARFYNEFEIMSKHSHPNLLKVYKLDKINNAYTMEYCDDTLENFVKENFDKEWFDINYKKDLVLQFLSGLKYLHEKGILHRDLSLRNVMIKKFDNNTARIKISDFGLAKDVQVRQTSTNSTKRGTILDPCLESFKDYGIKNEIYAIGFVIRYIFTNRYGTRKNKEEITKDITDRCFDNEVEKRFENVDGIIEEINKITTDTNRPVEMKVGENKDINAKNINDYMKITNKEEGIEFLLKKIIEDGDGTLFHLSVLEGEKIAIANSDFEINLTTSPVRVRVFWREIYETMKRRRYIEDRAGKDMRYEVTEKGIQKYDGNDAPIALIL